MNVYFFLKKERKCDPVEPVLHKNLHEHIHNSAETKNKTKEKIY